MGYSAADEEAAKRAEQDAGNNQANEAQKQQNKLFGKGAMDVTGLVKGAHKATTYINPAAADVQAGVYKDNAQQHLKDNDALQASNAGGLANSLSNMKANRGPVSVENNTLNARADATRGQQMQSLDLNRAAAEGKAPSLAAGQTTLGMNTAMAGRAGAMGSARGLTGLNGAQAAAGQGVAAQAGDTAFAGGMGRSKEIGDAIGMYGSQAGDVRNQDYKRLGISDQNSMFNADTNDKWKLGNANLAASQGRLGVAQNGTDMGWQQEAMDPAARQFENDQEMSQIQAGANAEQAAAQIARNRESRNSARSVGGQAFTAGMTIAGTALGGPAGGALGGLGGSTASKYF